MKTATILLTICVALSLFLTAWGLECYSCEGKYYHGDIEQMKNLTLECFESESFLEESDKKIEIQECWPNVTTCYKSYTETYDVIEGNKVISVKLITRSCGLSFSNDTFCETKKGSASYSATCYCDDDLCNSASFSRISIYSIISICAIHILLPFLAFAMQ